MSDRFRELVECNHGCAVILAGSDSDKGHIEKLTQALREYTIPHEIRIESAHNNPQGVLAIIGDYDRMRGSLAYITVAGGTDALSGIVARHSYRPVISCPPDAPNDSCLNNPPLSSNLYIAQPKNAARAVAQIFSHNLRYREKLLQEVETKRLKLREADTVLQQALSWCPEDDEKYDR